MTKVNHQLRKAAKEGDKGLIEALLLDPQCNPKEAGTWGETALMYAAENGYALCVKMLLPVSNCSARSMLDQTASELATARGYRELGNLIDAYILSVKERALLDSSTSAANVRKPRALRV